MNWMAANVSLNLLNVFFMLQVENINHFTQLDSLLFHNIINLWQLDDGIWETQKCYNDVINTNLMKKTLLQRLTKKKKTNLNIKNRYEEWWINNWTSHQDFFWPSEDSFPCKAQAMLSVLTLWSSIESCRIFNNSLVDEWRKARASSTYLMISSLPLASIEPLCSSLQRNISSAGHDGIEPRMYLKSINLIWQEKSWQSN